MNRFIVLLTAGLLVLAPNLAHSEHWPTLEDYVSQSTLIVKAKAISESGKRIRFRVQETWKGTYDPDGFSYKVPRKGFYASRGEHGVDVNIGDSIIFFFDSRHNQAVKGKLDRHSTAFPIRKGKIVYAATSMDATDFTVTKFKHTIKKIVKTHTQQNTKGSRK